MKKKVWAAVLAAMVISGAVLTGCSTQTEERSESVSPSGSSSQPAEPESSSQPDSSSGEQESSDDSAAIIVVPPVSSGTGEQGQITGELIINNGGIFGSGTDVLGTDADLDAWNQAISERDSIAGILVSSMNIDMNTERDLTRRRSQPFWIRWKDCPPQSRKSWEIPLQADQPMWQPLTSMATGCGVLR